MQLPHTTLPIDIPLPTGIYNRPMTEPSVTTVRPATLSPVIELPQWLMDMPISMKAKKELMATTYEAMFETILEKMADGRTLKSILRDDHREITEARYRTWIFNDESRLDRYYKARRVGADAAGDENVEIADATNNPLEDVARSALRVKVRRDRMEDDDRERFGKVKKLEVTTQQFDPDRLEKLSAMMTSRLRKSPDGVYDVDDNNTLTLE